MVPGAEKGINKLIGDSPQIPGMPKVYRRFWKWIAIRGMLGVALANIGVLSLFGDDDDWEDYSNMLSEQMSTKYFHKGKWLSVNIDPILPDSMVDPEKRRLLSVMGHFKDIFKIKHTMELIRGKASPVSRSVLSAVEGKDWKGARFTSFNEMFEDGVVPKLVADNQFERDTELPTFLSLLLYNGRQSIPIFASELWQMQSDETTKISGFMRMSGIDIHDTRRVPKAQQKFEEINSEVNELDKNLRDAQQIKDQKMIFEARRDIRSYEGYNRKKSRLGFTKKRIAVINKKLKPLLLKQKEGIELSTREEKEVVRLRNQKQDTYEKALRVLER